MKDARFIELVNLYIDRQISAEETAELETEIQASPRRRQTYQQYCHLHRATKLVYESFRADGNQTAGTAVQPGSVAYFAERRQRVRRNFWLSTAGGVAAAACLGLFVFRTGVAPADRNPAPAPKVAVAPAKAAPAPEMAKSDYAVLVATMRQADARSLALTQTQPVRPVSLFDDGVFDGKSGLTLDNHGVFRVKGKTDNRPATEFTAFQFQR